MRPDVPAELSDIARFVRELAADHDQPRTAVERWNVLSRVQREIDAGRLSDVTRNELREWWFGRGTLRTDGTGLRAPASRRALLTHLRQFVRWAIDQELRVDDPTRGLRPVRVPRSEPRPADRAAVDRAAAAASSRDRLAIELAESLGLRACEIARAGRDDLVRDDEGWWLWLTRKGGHRLRVAVGATLAAQLTKIPAGQPLIPSRVGGHLTAKGVSRLMSRAFAATGSPTRGHQLRHLAATELLAATGGDIVAVADQLGHRSVATTAGYTRAAAASVREALDRRAVGRRPRRRRTSTRKDQD